MTEHVPIWSEKGGRLEDSSLEQELERLLPELVGSNRNIASGTTGFGSRRDAYQQAGNRGRRQWDNAMRRAQRRSRRTIGEALRRQGHSAQVRMRGTIVVSKKPDRRPLPSFGYETVPMDDVIAAIATGDLAAAAEELFEAFKDAYGLEFDLSEVEGLEILFN